MARTSISQAISNSLAHYSTMTATVHNIYGFDWMSPYVSQIKSLTSGSRRDLVVSEDTISQVASMELGHIRFRKLGCENTRCTLLRCG